MARGRHLQATRPGRAAAQLPGQLSVVVETKRGVGLED